MSVPITISTGAIPRFLTHIQEAGIPDKVTNPYIKSVGFKSSNDSGLITVFRSLGFIDNSGATTERWRNYRDVTKSKSVLGQAIKEVYSGLFQVYPDAQKKDDEAISNWIRANTSFSGITVTRAVRTFRALCSEADFSATLVAAASNSDSVQHNAHPQVIAPTGQEVDLIPYPFPLENGKIAHFSVPAGMTKTDVERITGFLNALVIVKKD